MLADLLLQDKLAHKVSFTLPQGGMAIWLRFNEAYRFESVINKAREQNLFLKGSAYYKNFNPDLNSIRFGFASLDRKEMHTAITLLQGILEHN